MEIKIHHLDEVDASIFDGLEEKINEVFPQDIKVSVDGSFSFDRELVGTLIELEDDDNIFKYDSVIFNEEYFNLGKITREFDKEDAIRLFYTTKSFFHEAIVPNPIVHIGMGLVDDDQIEFKMNGTVDYDQNHLFIGGTSYKTDRNFQVIYHELFHLVTFLRGHCQGYVDSVNCLMNSPKQVYYSEEDENILGKEFCDDCKHVLEKFI